jgi:hypothetical protein
VSGSQPETTRAGAGGGAREATSSAPPPPSGDVRALPDPARLLVLVGVAVVGGLLATVPLGLTVLGAVEVVGLLQERWDPTWNDGDLGISAIGLAALLVLLGGVVAAGGAIGRVGRFSTPAVVVAAGLGTLLIASGAFALSGALRG